MVELKVAAHPWGCETQRPHGYNGNNPHCTTTATHAWGHDGCINAGKCNGGRGSQMRDMPEGGTSDIVGSRKSGEDSKSYRNFQLAKLKGLCCVQTNSKLPPI